MSQCGKPYFFNRNNVLKNNVAKMKGDDAMEKTMSPSKTITGPQIGKINELLAAALRKAGLQSELTQVVIEQQGKLLVEDLIAAIRARVGAVSNLIIRIVEKVDRTRSPQEALDATGRKQYIDTDVVKSLPRGTGDGAEVVFFKIGESVSDDNLEKEYERRGLIPADPYSLAAVNEVDPAFADTHPNGTHWKDAKDNWCFAAFDQWNDDNRNVYVNRDHYVWYAHWWFAGLRK